MASANPNYNGITIKFKPKHKQPAKKLEVTNVYFKCNANWYCQNNGLATGASLAAILTNNWMNYYDGKLRAEDKVSSGKAKVLNKNAPSFKKWF